jgi:hypothetical protein
MGGGWSRKVKKQGGHLTIISSLYRQKLYPLRLRLLLDDRRLLQLQLLL